MKTSNKLYIHLLLCFNSIETVFVSNQHVIELKVHFMYTESGAVDSQVGEGGGGLTRRLGMGRRDRKGHQSTYTTRVLFASESTALVCFQSKGCGPKSGSPIRLAPLSSAAVADPWNVFTGVHTSGAAERLAS